MKISTPAAATAAYAASYRADARRYDELLDAAGGVRRHWLRLIQRFAPHDRHAVRRCLQLTRRLIAENGVTYNVHADPQGGDRPWTLDPLPLVLTAEDWCEIEQGVVQRARALNALLTDLYGTQRLIAEGLVPAQIPFGHPNFLWPCQGIVPQGGIWLHLYAADLARAPDGHWHVIADRTQAPSGAGYTLENREIIEQILPDALLELGVRRVRGFFSELGERMLAHVDSPEAPLTVILTPGPHSETYFEHAYLAHQLGWPLVEGSDLTIRHDTVYLKFLGGLRRVHAILRRLDDDYCDPLELRSSSVLGVPGLLGAVRAGRVTLANALGTGALESPAWLAFLPAIAERLLGESLRLPATATWWCGERRALELVIEHLERFVIKPTFPNQRFEPVPGKALPEIQRHELAGRLRAQPHAYVAQEPLLLSQGPMLQAGGMPGLVAKPFSLRVYALATPGGSYAVMPGALALVAGDGVLGVASSQRGGGSKDVWVLSQGAASEVPDVSARHGQMPVRQEDVPSRLVENLYWMGRYNVRCEVKAQLLRATLAVRLDSGAYGLAIKFCRELDLPVSPADPAVTLGGDGVHGILADVRRMAKCASQVRGRLSTSCWHTVSELQRLWPDGAAVHGDARETLDRLLLSLAAASGLALDDMRQDQGWRLLNIGRRIERLQFLARLLKFHLAAQSVFQPSSMEWVVAACNSLPVYRSRYAAPPRLGSMLDLLIRDIDNPRALMFQSQAIASDLSSLTTAYGSGPQQWLTELVPDLSDTELMTFEAQDEQGLAARIGLAQRLRLLYEASEQFSDRLSMHYFSHTDIDIQALAT